MVEECLMVPGTLAVCIREVQKSLIQSSKRLIESKIQQLGVGDQFKILHDRIITPGENVRGLRQTHRAKRAESRNVGLGPEHDWSSHCADSFGYMAVSYEEPPASNSSGLNRSRYPQLPRGTFWSA
jgi:hypothetical protein